MACSASAAEADVFTHPKTADDLAKNLLAQPAKDIARTQVLRGRFLHRKYLSDIPAPLEAAGEFIFVRQRGLYWHTLRPFDSVFVLTPNAMSQQDEGGKAMKLDAASQPAIRAAAGIFMALFAVDLKALDKDFQMFGQPGAKDGQWLLGLRPKNSALTAVFTEAIISGAAQVRQVELRDGHGDRTVIELQDTELSGRAPTQQELALTAN
ncbi:MAG TPA: outer membrane lipoprotein carrier protein LolA [Steroidobacteraceae bacterium]|nr:outer membrane lipoprotein carrier protein LolA [Steroidobacteraceae bacterium]